MMQKRLIIKGRIRGIIVSIIFVSIFFIMSETMWLSWLPHIILFMIATSIPLTVLFIKTDTLKNAIWTGICIGTFTGILFFSCCFFTTSPAIRVELGLLIFSSIILTLVWIFSCTVGTVSSYYIRNRYRKNKEEMIKN